MAYYLRSISNSVSQMRAAENKEDNSRQGAKKTDSISLHTANAFRSPDKIVRPYFSNQKQRAKLLSLLPFAF